MAQSLQIKKLSPQHDAIIERLIVNPTINKGQLAAEFNMTRSHMSVIINSDAFKAAIVARRNEITAPVVQEMREKLTALADETIDRLLERVPYEADVSELSKLLKVATGALGMGTQASPAPAGSLTQININGIDKQTLEAARQIINSAQERVQPALEGEVMHVNSDDGRE